MLIKTKLAPPRQAIDALWRQALVGLIVAPPTRPLILVNAPAGFGKTTLLGQCYECWLGEGVIAAWYSVDDRRFESEQVFAYLMYALHRAGLPLPYSKEAIEAGLPGLATRNAANALLLALEASEEPVRLIIDDYHRIASPAVDAFIAHVINRLPAHASLVIATRGETGLPVSSLRAMGNVLSIDQTDLRFSSAEARSFFFGEEDGAVDLDRLMQQTEGWPAVLQLVRLWRAGRPGACAELSNLTRRSTDLANYLAEQVFAGLPAELQDFLLRTSIVKQVSGELADALTGGDGGQVLLDRLARMNMLVTPVDDLHRWYRYHPLLAEFLQDRFARGGRPEEVEALNARAARWYARAGRLADALDHAARLGDPQAAIAILEEAGGWRVGLRGGMPILRHLQNVTLTEPERYPRVWLGQVYLAGHEGRIAEARAILDRLLAALAGHPEVEAADPSLTTEVLTNEIVTRIYEDREIPEDALAFLRRELERPGGDAVREALLNHLLCLAAYEANDHARCQAYGEEALKRARANHLAFAETYVHQYLGLSRLAEGRRHEAEINFRRAADHARRHFGDGSAQAAIASVLLARAFYLNEAAGRAQELLDPALASIEEAEGWLDIFTAGYETQAWLHARAGDPTRAAQIIARAHRVAAGRALPRLAHHATVWQIRLSLHAGDIATAAALFDALRPLAPDLAARDPGGDLARRIAGAALGLAQGKDAATPIDALAAEAFDTGAIGHRIETLVLKALSLVAAGARRDGVLTFRSALDLAEAEGLTALLAQFGPMIAPLLTACQEKFDQLGPAERSAITRLGATMTQPGQVPRPMPGARDIIVTPREVDILRALADGLSSKEIARRLNIAESTVKTHRINVYRKLNVSLRSKAIQAARNMGLL